MCQFLCVTGKVLDFFLSNDKNIIFTATCLNYGKILYLMELLLHPQGDISGKSLAIIIFFYFLP